VTRNILVTGGAGFIGSNFVRYWENKYPTDNLVILDSMTYAANRKNLDGTKAILLTKSITNSSYVKFILSEFNIDTIVHFAAESHVDNSITDSSEFMNTNILGTFSLLESVQDYNHIRFHHVSTDEVYGSLDFDDQPFTEFSQYQPNSPYSASKAASDHLVRAWNKTYNLKTTISHCSNNYGRFQYPEKLIPSFILKALYGNLLPIYGDGKNVRDWLHVIDHCRGIDLILNKGKIGETYCIGGGIELSNIQLVDIICDSIDNIFNTHTELKKIFPDCPPSQNMKTNILKTFVVDRLGHDKRYAINYDKMKNLGYAPKFSFETHIANIILWYISEQKSVDIISDMSYYE
jgi:dTDP-glucose 4,6-dehydratase